MSNISNKALFLIIGDLLLSLFALSLGFLVRFGHLPSFSDFTSLDGTIFPFYFALIRIVVYVAVLLLTSFILEMYDLRQIVKKGVILLQSGVVFFVSLIVLSIIYYLVKEIMLGRGIVLLTLGFFALFQATWHICYQFLLNVPVMARRVLILGTGPLAGQIGGLIAAGNYNHVLSGYVNCPNEALHVSSDSIVGTGDELVATAIRERADKIVVSLGERRGVFPLRDVLDCKLNGIEVVDAPSMYEQLTGKLLIENINPSWLIFSSGFRITQFVRTTKRLFDVFCSVVGITLALPLFPLIALSIKLSSPGPIIFRQIRVGEREEQFMLYKFRTMSLDAEAATGAVWAKEDDPRITRLGKFLRKTRLDELPQLFNVLIGDMSFVGPRPERPEFVEKLKEIIPYYSERHIIKPGLTGWAQIRYPYGASIEDALEKLRYDLFYIKNFSFTLELLIILDTIKVVLFGRGAR